MTNINAAKLNTSEVQGVRDLARAGFTSTTIARSLGVVPRSIYDILKGRSWWHLPDVPCTLPLLTPDRASRLRLRGTRKLSQVQRIQLEEYRKALDAMYQRQAASEGRAIDQLREWTRTERLNAKVA